MILSNTAPAASGMRYDLADYMNPEALAFASHGAIREDAASSALFLRDLTEVMGRTFDVKYADLKARQIFPIFTGVDPAAESYVWRQYDRRGTAKVIHDYSADLPTSEVLAAEYQSRILSLGTSYKYSIQDLRRARMAGIPLETRQALAARRAMEQAFEQICWFGVRQTPGTVANSQALEFAPTAQNTNDPMAMYGAANFPGLTGNSTLNNWLSASTSVSTIVQDFKTYLELAMINATNGIHTPNAVVFPLSTWAALNTQARSTTFTDDTVLQYLLKTSPWVKNVYWTPMLETAGLKQDGSTPGPRILVMERNEENFQMVVPQEFEQLPPEIVNMSFKVLCHMRVGGFRISYPKSIYYLDGMNG
jgi:hypothetical protein